MHGYVRKFGELKKKFFLQMAFTNGEHAMKNTIF